MARFERDWVVLRSTRMYHKGQEPGKRCCCMLDGPKLCLKGLMLSRNVLRRDCGAGRGP